MTEPAPCGHVGALFLRDAAGRRAVDALAVDREGIAGAVARAPLRQLLLVEAGDLARLGLARGALHEDVVLEWPGLMARHSGSVLAVGTARLCLTFRCEPCARVRGLAPAKLLAERRGYLARVVDPGTLRAGDTVALDGQRFDEIPDRPRDRAAWVLARAQAPMRGAELLHEAGLHGSYARALPAWSRTWPPEISSRLVRSTPRR